VKTLRRLGVVSLLTVVVLTAGVGARQNLLINADVSPAFESYIELLRAQAGIPAISGALLQDGEVVWERGLGFANVESRIRATADTPYFVADLTQTFSAVLLLQCVEQRHLSLDEPVERYGVSLPEGGITMRRILNHTSTAAAGAAFKYDPERFSHLTGVMEHCAPQPYRKSLAHRLLEFLAMIDSVPGRDLQTPDVVPEDLFDAAALERYAHSLQRMAVPYRVDKKGRAFRTEQPSDGINAASGLVSTVRDLAHFDAALDAGRLLQEETLKAAWSPTIGANGAALPMGLGWFTQSYRGTPIVWHFGLVPNAYSALVVKVPSRHATLILLANSDGLAVPFQLEAGDVTRSLFASVFLRMLL
jgi:CubicO group peptidase (beta-lactamase class C family)